MPPRIPHPQQTDKHKYKQERIHHECRRIELPRRLRISERACTGALVPEPISLCSDIDYQAELREKRRRDGRNYGSRALPDCDSRV